MDFLKTSVYQEAQRRVTDEAKGKSVMQSFKHLKEKFGRRTAEKIRDKKKDLEARRDSTMEPRAWWFAHPEAQDDPAALLLFFFFMVYAFFIA